MKALNPITIAGGGLAGLSLGIALQNRGVPVSVVESGSYPRHRVCGEFISGVTPEDLETLGIPDALSSAVENWTTSWFSGDDCFLENKLPVPAMGISRYSLDAKLANSFTQSGGDLKTGSRFSPSEKSEEGTVLAIGRPRRAGSRWIGLKAHVRDFPLQSDLEMHLGAAGYLGISRIENGVANACGLFRVNKSIKASKTELLLAYLEENGLKELRDRIRNSKIDPESCLGVNAFELGHQLPAEENPDHIVLGDQFAIIGPFTGNGMSMAFQSSALAVDPVLAYATGDLNWADCVNETTDLLRINFKKRLRVSQFLHPFLTEKVRQKVLIQLGRRQLLPFATLFRLLRS